MSDHGLDREGSACPLQDTDDKVQEAHYFLHRALGEYHVPEVFRWNLNAFLQALRSVTLYLQSEMSEVEGFREWYTEARERLREDEMLRRFVEGRNVVAHARNLATTSSVRAGVFRGRALKLGLGMQIAPSRDSAELIVSMQRNMGWIDEDHSAIGEQYGVERIWTVDDLDSESEVTSVCHSAWSRIVGVVADAHEFLSFSHLRVPEEPNDAHDYRSYNVLLESDLDPDAIDRWGW